MNDLKGHTQKISREAKVRAAKRRKIMGLSISLGVAALILTLNLVLFVPYTAGGYDISEYKSSEYYSLMEKIGDITYRPYKTNNFKEWDLGAGYTGKDEDMAPSGESAPSGTYEEVTNNQVQGVVEGDLFKRSSEYIYYVSWEDNAPYYVLYIYSIPGENLVKKFPILCEDDVDYYDYYNEAEMFLSPDLNTVTLFTMCRSWRTYRLYTKVISIDVSDPAEPGVVNCSYVTGGYVSARNTDGKFLLTTTFTFSKRPDFAYEENFLPQCGENIESLESFPMEKIFVPDSCDRAQYTNLVLFDETLKILDRASLFSYTSEIYVSNDHLFVAREVEERGKAGAMEGIIDTSTEVSCYSYGDSFGYEGTMKVKGEIVNQYSMDECENTFRIVTTYYCADELPWHPECNLYVFDLEDFRLKAEVLDFSDEGESVKSVRFDGKKAYVCTAKVEYGYDSDENYVIDPPIVIWDPVFEFDLSDLENITWKDTGTISGYSMSLIKFKDDTLLGIGYGENFNELKVEIYRANEDSVARISQYIYKNCRFSSDFKSYFIDAERGLVGFGITYDEPYLLGGSKPRAGYLILKADGAQLETVGRIQFDEVASDDRLPRICRACIVGEKIFVLCGDEFEVIEL